MKNLEKSLKRKNKAISVLRVLENIFSPILYTCAVSTFITMLFLQIAPPTIGFAIATGCSLIGLCGSSIAKTILEASVRKQHKKSIQKTINTRDVIIENYQKSNSAQATNQQVFENNYANKNNSQNLEK